MKKLLVIVLCTLGLVGILALCPPPPEEPVCGEGQITVTPAVWVAGTPAIPGYCHVVVRNIDMSQYYKRDGNSDNCTLRLGEKWRAFVWPYPPMTSHNAWVPGTPATEGYWTDPVCRDPLLTAEVTSTCDGVFLQTFTEGEPDGDPVLLYAWVDPYAIETFLYKDATYEEPTECLEYRKTCDVIGKMWYECQSGTWTYTGTSANKCWCGGLTGNRVVKESYDCGQTWYWYYNGEPIEPMNFGMYPAPACYGQ